jgi:two-component sensor histidine kinase
MDDKKTPGSTAELMHRVKNNFQLVLSLINLQNDFAIGIEPEDANRRLMTRVHSIALVQELLYLNLRSESSGEEAPSVGIRELVEHLSDYCVGIYDPQLRRQQILCNISAVQRLGSHEAIAAALIFNEILLNCALFNSPNPDFQINVESRMEDDTLSIVWTHRNTQCPLVNGVPDNQGLGSLLIENYCAQLGGAVHHENTAGEYIITLKLALSRLVTPAEGE